MIEKIIHSVFKRRHFWRYATFGEIAELYASRLLRIVALHMISMFIVVYLYTQGYSLLFIAGYMVCYYTFKIPVAFIAARCVARFGPKHTILLGNLLYIPALLVFGMVPEASASYGILILAVFGTLQAFGATLYDYAYLVDFSKVKHVEHAGKELGYMHIVEKAGNIVSPVLGGILATFVGPVFVTIVAACLFAAAALPLLRTPEPIKTHQKIKWRGFPWRKMWRSFVGESGVGFDILTTGAMWQLFLVTIVFAASQGGVYAIVGALASIGVAVSFVTAFIFGRLIDNKAGGILLKYGVIAKSLSHLLRPATGGAVNAAAINVGSEVAITAYAMSFTRGIFDQADYSGYRLFYFMCIEAALNFGAVLASGLAFVLFWLFEPKDAFTIFFVCAAVYVLLITLPRFAIYKRTR